MNDLNSVLIEGNLVRDPIGNHTPKGTEVSEFTVAVNRYYRNPSDDGWIEEVSYLDVVAFGLLAGRCNDLLVKGRKVRVVGRLKQDRWDDNEGNLRSRVKIVAEHVEFKPQSRPKEESSATANPADLDAATAF